jgi:hypothetical protein
MHFLSISGFPPDYAKESRCSRIVDAQSTLKCGSLLPFCPRQNSAMNLGIVAD